MGYDAATAERLRAHFADRADVAEKRMVGGLSFVVKLAEPHVRPLEMGRRPVRGFVLIDPAGFSTDAALSAWVRRGLDFVGTARETLNAGGPA